MKDNNAVHLMGRPLQFGIIPFGAVGDIPKRRLVCIYLKFIESIFAFIESVKKGSLGAFVSGWDHETDLYNFRDLYSSTNASQGSLHVTVKFTEVTSMRE